MSVFQSADILLPKSRYLDKWAVIACDQYSSEKDYWQEVDTYVKDEPSALRLILPEAFLDHTDTEEIGRMNENMRQYLESGVFDKYPDSYVYVERTLNDGHIRRGLVGAIDLEEYDYQENSEPMIRATEKTVPERIPPRLKIRENALLELPHVLMLADDIDDAILGACEDMKEELPLLYDFELMKNGGRITGRLVSGENKKKLDEAIERYEADTRKKNYEKCGKEIVYSIGDGNHSIATAKAHYEKLKKQGIGADHPARYAMLELVNLHDDSLVFEPIHRLIETDVKQLLADLEKENAGGAYPLSWVSGNDSGTLYLKLNEDDMPLAVFQEQIDRWLEDHEGEIDYIHGEDTLQKLAEQEGAIGFFMPAIDKNSMFADILNNGVLPRKTFSMGHANEKRYYIESRKIL